MPKRWDEVVHAEASQRCGWEPKTVTVSRTGEDGAGWSPPILGRKNRLIHSVEGSVLLLVIRCGVSFVTEARDDEYGTGSCCTSQTLGCGVTAAAESCFGSRSESGFLAFYPATDQRTKKG